MIDIEDIKKDFIEAAEKASPVLVLSDPILSELAEIVQMFGTGREGTGWNLVRSLWDRRAPSSWK